VESVNIQLFLLIMKINNSLDNIRFMV